MTCWHFPKPQIVAKPLGNKRRRQKRMRRRRYKFFPVIVKPMGTISLLSGNSSGVEPMFDTFKRRMDFSLMQLQMTPEEMAPGTPPHVREFDDIMNRIMKRLDET